MIGLGGLKLVIPGFALRSNAKGRESRHLKRSRFHHLDSLAGLRFARRSVGLVANLTPRIEAPPRCLPGMTDGRQDAVADGD
jgi:hypothetical protein